MDNYGWLALTHDLDIIKYLLEYRTRKNWRFWNRIVTNTVNLSCRLTQLMHRRYMPPRWQISSVTGYNYARKYMTILNFFLTENKKLSVTHLSSMIFWFGRTVLQWYLTFSHLFVESFINTAARLNWVIVIFAITMWVHWNKYH